MRVLKRNPWLAGLGALVATLVVSGRVAWADTTTDRGASILVFPKVIADGTRDTVIQVSNLSNGLVYVHCVYVDASTEIPGLPPGPTNPRRWQEHDFPLRLTRQQPTVWRVSTGRIVNPQDNPGACLDTVIAGVPRQTCPGIDPGNIPNVRTFASGFEGELKCVQVDSSGFPTGGNALKGEALIEGATGTGLVSEYNAIGIQAIDPSGSFALNLDNAEYNACPGRLIVNHFGQGADDPALLALGAAAPGDVAMETELTLIPCTENFESLDYVDGVTGLPVPGPQVTVQMLAIDEMEVGISRPARVDCWRNDPLRAYEPVIFDAALRNSTVFKTTIRPASGRRCRGGTMQNLICTDDVQCLGGGLCADQPGVLGVVEEYRVQTADGIRTGAAAANVHMEGSRNSDVITLQQ